MNLFQQFFKDDWHFLQYKVAKKVNGVLYFLSRIPGIKKLISTAVFSAYTLKKFLSALLTFLAILFSFLKKVMILFMMYGVQCLIVKLGGETDFLSIFLAFSKINLYGGLWLWVLSTTVGMGFYEQFTALLPQSIMGFYQEFLISRTRFILGQKFVEVIKNAFFYLPAAFFYGQIVGQGIQVLLLTTFSYLSCHFAFMLVGNELLLKGLRKWARRGIALLAGTIVFLIIGAGYPGNKFTFFIGILLNPLFLLLFIFLSIILFYRVWYYRKNQSYIMKVIDVSQSFYEVNLGQKRQNEQYIGQGIKMQSKIEINKDEKIRHLKGNQYLNSLLFSRYRNVLNRRLKYFLIGLAATAILCGTLGMLQFLKGITEAQVTMVLPFLFFFMYWASFGKNIVQILFVNCDVSMLYYPFYREAKTILNGFNYRLKRTFYYNTILILGIFLIFLILHVSNHFFLSWQFFAVLLLLLVSLTLLFSFHELFIYYLLQPFTTELTVKSPLYKIVTGIFYWIAYMNVQIRVANFSYVIAISLISIIYVFVGMIVIYKIAPKTFKIKV